MNLTHFSEGMRLGECQIADALIDTRLVMTSRLVGNYAHPSHGLTGNCTTRRNRRVKHFALPESESCVAGLAARAAIELQDIDGAGGEQHNDRERN